MPLYSSLALGDRASLGLKKKKKARKKKKIQSFPTTWIEVEIIVSQKDKCCLLSLICGIQKIKTIELMDIESGRMLTRGWGPGKRWG